MCASIVFKAKTKEKYEENFVYGFYFKTQKCPFWGVNQFFFLIFFRFSFSNNKHTNVILIGIFENAQKNLFTAQNSQNGAFDG